MAPLTLDSPVARIRGARPADTARFQRLGIATVRDLLLAAPFEMVDFGAPKAVADLPADAPAVVVGTVVSMSARTARARSGMRFAEARLRDPGGGVLKVIWFQQPWIARSYPPGSRIGVAGTVKRGSFGPPEMLNPRHWPADSGRVDGIETLFPKYHLTRDLTTEHVARLVEAVLPLATHLDDPLPERVRRRQRLLSLPDAVRQAHRPRSPEEWAQARDRFTFQRGLELQLAFVLARRERQSERAEPVPFRLEVIERFKAGLPFQLTRAQRRSAWEIFRDLELDLPMNRLLNGDVGAGKTAVAAAVVAMVHAAGLRSLVMAPTEVLARQHLQKFRDLLEESFPDLRVELLVSGLPAAERRRVRTAAASGHCALLVGTHTLIEEDVQLPDLGLAVVDEQHRFGTRQRELLRQKGTGRPHFLAMTATPIPRSLALALYGDMAVSYLDELPPGRRPVTTTVVTPEHRDSAYRLVRREVLAGRQAFVICPLVEESGNLAATVRAATTEFQRLRTDVFPGLRLSLVHGRMRDKDGVMREFAAGGSDILVATSVVEVGVDVPNASVIMVEGADRFGLAQLHQLRGRVGRGTAQSHCLLLVEDDRNNSRLNLMTVMQDGFELARADLEMRGAGELVGDRQHGDQDLAMQALQQPRFLDRAREEAELMLFEDPELEESPDLRDRVAHRLDGTSIS